jgi:predicted nucleic acid-binding protein
MPAVVCDTGPLNYLILIEAADLLPRLFSPVLMPAAVKSELLHLKAPAAVRDWVADSPSWLSVVPPDSYIVTQIPKLGTGESEVIALGLDRPGSLVLMDDRSGTSEAVKRGLNVVGTLALLDRAASRGWIKLPEAFRQLQATSFRAPLRLMARMLEADAHRKG